MNCKLVAITQPAPYLIEQGIKNLDDLFAYCARVSAPKNQLKTETAPKLIKYLIDHKHWSPFEMGSMTIEIETSRAISAQIARHRSFSFQEFSQRYSSPSDWEHVELRKQGETNRQSSTDLMEDFGLSIAVYNHMQSAFELYNTLVEKGVARECARGVLPMNTKTKMYMAGTVRSWIHYIDLRSDEHTQKEHRDIALIAKDIFVETLPQTAEALSWK